METNKEEENVMEDKMETWYQGIYKGNRMRRVFIMAIEVVHTLFCISFYDFIKKMFAGDQLIGFTHAQQVIGLEQGMGLFFEPELQRMFLESRWWIVSFWNSFYVLGHFGLTIVTILIVAILFPRVYFQFRNVFFWMNVLGISFYAIWPLMPPRLVSEECGIETCPDFGFVDTLATEEFQLSFIPNPTHAKGANSYAAMPSMHVAWALCTGLIGLFQMGQSYFFKVVGVAYPLLMVVCVVVTANHFWLDAVGGLLAFLGGVAVLYFFPQKYEYGLGSKNSQATETLAAYFCLILSIGIVFMNATIPVSMLGVIFSAYFIGKLIVIRKEKTMTVLPA